MDGLYMKQEVLTVQIYCGVYRERQDLPAIAIIHDTDTDSYYACNQFAEFVRFSGVHVTGEEYELGAPANTVWSGLRMYSVE